MVQTTYDIIKAHGCEIKVETKEGEGSEFIILLPAYYSPLGDGAKAHRGYINVESKEDEGTKLIITLTDN